MSRINFKKNTNEPQYPTIVLAPRICKMRGCRRLTNRFGEEGSREGKRGGGIPTALRFIALCFAGGLTGARAQSRGPRAYAVVLSLRRAVLLLRGEFAGEFLVFCVKLVSVEWGTSWR